ncbi:MAG: sigma-70 family RNA polymerase sigma factor [Verrucomicrobiota bacterium]
MKPIFSPAQDSRAASEFLRPETPEDDAIDAHAALMVRARNGDMDAFALLVDSYKRSVTNFVSRMLADEREAEDIAQTVFVHAYKSAHRYRPSARFSTWLFTIARNLCLNEIRRRGRHPTDSWEGMQGDLGDHFDPCIKGARQVSPTDAALRHELEAKVQEALSALPENQRTAMLLCVHEDLSYEEIAGVLDCSPSAIKSLIHRARESLRVRLKPYLRTGFWQETCVE